MLSTATRLCLLPLIALFALAIAAHAEQPFFMGLGIPVGTEGTIAYGVSDNGLVVVGATAGPSGPSCFRWTRAEGIVGFGGGLQGAFAASADGSVIVGGPSGNGISYAFRWTSSGGSVSLGGLPGYDYWSTATGVSDDGSVVAGIAWATRSTTPGQAYRWTTNGGMVGLGDLPGGDFHSVARDISADGSVVVGLGSSALGDEAFRWTSDGGMLDLGYLPGGYFSTASEVSADGSVVVGFSRSESEAEAFRWTSGGGMVGLGHLAGGSFSSAFGVSADGSVIAGSSNSASGNEAVIWQAGYGMRSLRDMLVAEHGLDLTGWILNTANDISADGRTIVGQGTNPQGKGEAWIAHLGSPVPEPATLVLSGCALAVVVFVRLRRLRK